MRIAVMGAGSIGGYFGGMLAKSGHDVTLIARGKRITQAIDVSQMIVKRMNEVGYEISDVRISSDSLVSKDGQKRNVSKIEIDIKNSSIN